MNHGVGIPAPPLPGEPIGVWRPVSKYILFISIGVSFSAPESSTFFIVFIPFPFINSSLPNCLP